MAANNEVKPIKYYTFINMNKPVFYWGFTSVQLGFSVGTIIVVGLFSIMFLGYLIGLLIGVALSTPVYISMRIIRKENNKGNPDYVKSFQMFYKTPKRVVDEQEFMKAIFKNGKGV